ncbi:MAG: acyl-CoA desaturase [Parcubacteria group bacterium]|nr:acyl-CoA desaturase [Parcubacteria group bacterium]
MLPLVRALLKTPEYPRASDEVVDWIGSIPYLLFHAVGLVGPIVLLSFLPFAKALLIATTFGVLYYILIQRKKNPPFSVKMGAVIIAHVTLFLALGTKLALVALLSMDICFVLFFVRIFFIHSGYHVYFSHKAFKTGRWWQLLLAVGGEAALQKGPLWWAGIHRLHHSKSDTPEDPHTPKKGFLWSHMLWVMCPKYQTYKNVGVFKDFGHFPELVWLERWYLAPPVVLGMLVFLAGFFLGGFAYGIVTLTVGFFLSTVLVWHWTYSINSVAHSFGTQNYETTAGDTSRNNEALHADGGEENHNNHHHDPVSIRFAFFNGETDFSYPILKWFERRDVIWDVKETSPEKIQKGLLRPHVT